MSNKELCIKLLDTIPEIKLSYALAYLQGLSVDTANMDVEIPNEITVAAIAESERMLADPSTRRFHSVEELFEELDSE